MGLYVQSLANIPDVKIHKDYFVYLLDYGWNEPLGETLMKNYENMAKIAAENKAVVIRGPHRVHFEDEVLSWHNVNGENAEEILPAILITNRHPRRFKETFQPNQNKGIESDLKLILIPLKRFCNSTSEVATLIDKLFKDIKDKKDLDDFRVSKEIRKGFGRAVADAVILEPNFAGLGFSFNKMFEFFRKK